jgi:hypothetical protein
MNRSFVRGLSVWISMLILLVAVAPAEGRRRSAQHPGAVVLRFTQGRLATAAHPSAFELTERKTIQFSLYLTSKNVRLIPMFNYRRGFEDNPWSIFLTDAGQGSVLRLTYGKLSIHGTATLPLRTWLRVTIVADGTTGAMYFNEKAIPANVFLNDIPLPGPRTDRTLEIGRFHGSLSQVRIWNRALTKPELDALAAGQTAAATDLAVHWPLDDGTGRFARDLGPNGIPLQFPFVGGAFLLDEAPRWVDANRLASGPYFDLVRYFDDVEPAVPASGRESALLDITGDGRPEIIDWRGIPLGQFVCSYPYIQGPPPPATVFRNLGSSFAADPALIQTEASLPFRVYAADFTGDRLPDLFSVQSGAEFLAGECPASNPGGQSRLLVRQPSGGLRDETGTRLPQRIAYDHAGTVGDFDNDGDIDIALFSFAEPKDCTTEKLVAGAPCPTIWINDGSGGFTGHYDRLPATVSNGLEGFPATNYPASARRNYTSAATLDADRDGDLDLILGGWSAEPYDPLLLNDGTGRFSRAPAGVMPGRPSPTGQNPVPDHVVWIATGDVNGDQWPDIVSASYQLLTLYLNNGNGTFRIAENAFSPAGTERGGYMVTIADLNADGHPDLIVEELPYDRILFNRGNGTFVEMDPVDDFDIGWNLWPADVDGDGDLDLAGTDCCTPGFFVMYQRKRYAK